MSLEISDDNDVLSWLERRKKKKLQYKENSDPPDVQCNQFQETSVDVKQSNRYENR